jgi:hypothetical protein
MILCETYNAFFRLAGNSVCHRELSTELHRHEQDAEGTDEKEELHEEQTIDDHLFCSQ